MKKLAILILSLITINIFSLYSEEIVIRINGEEYSREMPEDIDGAKSLIRDMSKMINTSDDTIISLKSDIDKNNYDTKNKISSLESKLLTLEQELENANKLLADSEKGINSLVKTNTRNTPFLVLGPTIGSDKSIGFHFALSTEYRIFRNFHIGGSIFSTVYTNSDNRNFDIGAGLMIGYSIK